MIRKASNADWPEIEALLRAMGFTDSEPSARLEGRYARYIVQEDHGIWVAVDGERLVGYAWAQDFGPHLRTGDSVARLHDLWVAEASRMRGIGRALFDAVKVWALARGARWLQWQSATDAVGFYEALGLEPTRGHHARNPFYEIKLWAPR